MIDFHTVYARHAADLRRFALYLTGNPALADDLVADAFVRLWTTTTAIRTETVKGYLIAIVRNLYLNSRRRDARDVPLDDTHAIADVAASIVCSCSVRVGSGGAISASPRHSGKRAGSW